MKVVWAKEAGEDIERLFAFLLDKSPSAAAKAVEAIHRKVDVLVEFPEIGPLMNDDSGRREFFIPFGAGAYVLRYYIVSEEVLVIVRVWHSRELRS